jgi:uncharacterized Zn finger protein (UPF0148 family)
MTDQYTALIPVGRNCDCGMPLVWHHGGTWCAVYGSHPPEPPPITVRQPTELGTALIAALMSMDRHPPRSARHSRPRPRRTLT